MHAMSRRAGLALAVIVSGFAAVTTLVGVAFGAPPEFLVLDLATGMSFVVAGLVAAWLRPGTAPGPLLLACAALWYVGSYAPTGHPVLTNMGFAFERYYDLVLAGLLLLLSSANRRPEPRWILATLAGAMVVRSLGRLFLQDAALFYPDCEWCPPNPFAIWPDLTRFETVEIASNAALTGLLAVVGVLVLWRLVHAGPVLRRARWPILAAGLLAMGAAAFEAFEYAYSTATGLLPMELPEPWAAWFSWAQFGARTIVPLAVLAATLRLHRAAGPLGPLAADLEQPSPAGTIEGALRGALGDPSLVLLRPIETGGWRTEAGLEQSLPGPDDTARAVTWVGPADQPLAAMVHDAALLDQPELVQAVARVVRLTLENDRLEAELRDQLATVTESRQRIVTAAEDERRRVERDLHDGAQQRLIAAMLELQQARTVAGASGSEALRARLDGAADALNAAIRELRELARGIHPAILEEEGLGAAVAGLARRSAVPVEVNVELTRRLPRLVESTAYFTIAEALTNAQRHAGASHATVTVTEVGGTVTVEVRDDGVGGADATRGSGIRGLADRVTALGGRLDVESPPNAGTLVRARIPTP